jgi:pyruvate/2-oxoglutarate dehydrogenase complex dihydrolipoamide dehydrogenase (E3) component
MPEFDIAVIGAGAAGLTVTAVAAQLGLRVALIERDRMGGDCLNTGCVPSKALLASAHAVQLARQASRLGINFGAPEIDWSAVTAHVQGVIAAIAPMDSVARFRGLGAQVIRGEARFTGPRQLSVSGHGALSARRIVVAAGSRAAMPAIPGLAEAHPLTNETLFGLAARPEHLLILGGGAVGMEMAQAHAALGVRVTVVESGAIAGREDPELADGLRRALTASGIALHENVRVVAVEPGPVLVLADGLRLAGSHLLVAAGRTPNLAALDLPAGQVQATPLGIATDAGLRSLTNKAVFAAGDIADPLGIGPRAFTHVAGYHAGIVLRRAVFRLPARLDDRALPRVIYTDPELAQVGLTEAEARAAGHDIRILRWPLADNDRAQAERRVDGLVKLVASRRGAVLGAGILAPHAGEMIGMWALAIQQRIPLSALAGLILPYPTRAEAGKRAAGQFFAPRLFAPMTQRLVRWLARLP